MLKVETYDGQSAKTRNYYKMLCKKYGSDSINMLDTHFFKKKFIRNILKCVYMGLTDDAIIIMPTKWILSALANMFLIFKKIRGIKVIYVVVGGWLSEYVAEHRQLVNKLNQLDKILVETESLKKELELLGLTNVVLSPNFSTREHISKEKAISTRVQKPYKLFTFSRVTKSKGITEAIIATEILNARGVACTLDVFGMLDEEFREEFETEAKRAEACVTYKGVLKDNIIETLNLYHLMLFPTYYPGECFPGAVLEAMMAGVPVIASDWRHNKDIVKEDFNGYLYDLDSTTDLIDKTQSLLAKPEKLQSLRVNCWHESQRYSPESVMCILYSILDN